MQTHNRRVSLIKVFIVATATVFLAGASASAGQKNPNRVNTASKEPVLSVAEPVPSDVLAKHRTASLLLLHVNDIHDIIKAPQEDLGGMAFISGYVHRVRSERKDVLMLDAGDLFQKGDRMSVASKGEVAVKALAATTCDLTVPGNHDFAYGVGEYRRNLKQAGLEAVCAGMEFTDNNEYVFKPYKELRIGDLRVAVIGGTANTSKPTENGRQIRKFDVQELGQRIHNIALELRPKVDLIIVLLHNGTAAGMKIAQLAPEVQIVVCGHTDEVTEKPIVAPTGALVLEVGRAGKWVGRLDAVVDLDAKTLGKYGYQLVPMDRKRIEPDTTLLRQIADWEKRWCPEAGVALAQAPDGLRQGGPDDPGDIGKWLGQAALEETGADVLLLHRDFFRKGIPPGPVTSDDIYKTMQPRYCRKLATAKLKGTELERVLILCAGKRGEHVYLSGASGIARGVGKRFEVDANREYTLAFLETHLQRPARHEVGIKPLLEEMNVQWNLERFSILDAASDFAKSQKILKVSQVVR